MATYSRSFRLDDATLETVESRVAFFLDTNIWIKLADAQTPQAKTIRERLIAFVDAEKVFCPLAMPTIIELRKQKGTSKRRTAALMERLSLNVTYREINQIYHSEIDHFLEYLRSGTFRPLGIHEIYGPLLSYLSDGFKIEGVKGMLREKGQPLVQYLGDVVNEISLIDFLELLGGVQLPEPDTANAQQKQNIARREIAGASINKARRIEMEYIAKNIILPRLNEERSKLPLKEQFEIVQKTKALPRNKRYDSAIEHVLRFMPALQAYVEVMTLSGLDTNRKDCPNDFYDRDFLVYGLSYAEAFCSKDRWISSLVNMSRKSDLLGHMAFANGLRELDRRLDCVE